jgi:DNA-directed RNA polymerase subunit RPC12/RpoP|tara:strand:- start:295 stop:489 length:195 start_codon:yes stop_codon:yes gene_type:complete
MAHKVFIRHTYIYKCSNKQCGEEWKVNEADELEKLHCPHCGTKDNIEYVLVDQRTKYQRKWNGV